MTVALLTASYERTKMLPRMDAALGGVRLPTLTKVEAKQLDAKIMGIHGALGADVDRAGEGWDWDA